MYSNITHKLLIQYTTIHHLSGFPGQNLDNAIQHSLMYLCLLAIIYDMTIFCASICSLILETNIHIFSPLTCLLASIVSKPLAAMCYTIQCTWQCNTIVPTKFNTQLEHISDTIQLSHILMHLTTIYSHAGLPWFPADRTSALDRIKYLQ